MEIVINFKSITIKYFKTSPDNPNNRHLFADIHFDVIVNNKKYENITIPVSQFFGEGSIGGEIEVGSIKKTDYDLAWNHNQFVDKVKEYFKMCIGPNGRLINSKDPKCYNLIMENCTLGLMHTTKIEAEPR